MNNFTKNILGMSISLSLVVGVFGLAVWGVTSYIDKNYGSGVAGLVFMLVIGVGGTVVIYTISNFQTNRTHQSAGDDITEFFKGANKALTERNKLDVEYARMEREQLGFDQKHSLIDKRSEVKRDDWQWQQEQRRKTAERAAEEAERQQSVEAEWWTVGGEHEDEVLQ